MTLLLCPTCQRHVKPRDPRCPFCGTAMQSTAPFVPSAAVVLGLGIALAGCGSSIEPSPVTDATADVSGDNGPAPAYGPPPDTGRADTGADMGPIAAYGPPPDTGAEDTTPADSGMAGAYGPPPDTGAS
ncbi:MAG: hypothetical protein HYV09_02215 [Deltaproteobacteria bacterium]|nr:hypothetical protein [Deltaproteobacteria bacterium]